MNELARLCGFIASHAVWNVSEAPLVPLLAYERDDGNNGITRFSANGLQEAIAHANAWLNKNPESAVRAAAAIDGFFKTASGQEMHALRIEAFQYQPAMATMSVAIPFQPPIAGNKLVVHKLNFIQPGTSEADLDELAKHFFDGVEQHPQGAKLWVDHFDASA